MDSMLRQERIINKLFNVAEFVAEHRDSEVIIATSTKSEDITSTWIEASQSTMLTVGVSMAVKSAINSHIPLFILQELIAKMYEDVRDGKECKENESD